MEALIALPASLFVGIASAWVTAHLSLKRFRAEKWWEMRVRAYERVIGALHDTMNFASVHFDAVVLGQRLSDTRKLELSKNLADAQKEIARAADMGGFILSEKARDRLKEYQTADLELEGSEVDWGTRMDQSYGAANTCLQDIIKIAREDLEVK